MAFARWHCRDADLDRKPAATIAPSFGRRTTDHHHAKFRTDFQRAGNTYRRGRYGWPDPRSVTARGGFRRNFSSKTESLIARRVRIWLESENEPAGHRLVCLARPQRLGSPSPKSSAAPSAEPQKANCIIHHSNFRRPAPCVRSGGIPSSVPGFQPTKTKPPSPRYNRNSGIKAPAAPGPPGN